MIRNRIITIALLIGVLIVGITFLGAARMSGDDGKTKDGQKNGTLKAGSKGGVVVFGTGGMLAGPGLVPVFPENFPMPSKIKKLYVSEGDVVEKGAKLMEFDAEAAEDVVKKAKGGLAKAEGALKQAEGYLQAAEGDVLRAQGAQQRAEVGVAVMDQAIQAHQFLIDSTERTLKSKAIELEGATKAFDEAKARAERIGAQNDPDLRAADYKVRSAKEALEAETIKLTGMKAVTPKAKKEEAEAAVKEAKGAVAAANGGVARANGGIAEAKGAIEIQKAELAQAEYALRMMTLKAPIGGKIIRMPAIEGLSFGQQTREPLMLIQPEGKMIVRAEVDQEFASRVVVGQEAQIQDDGNPNLKWTGKVIRVSDAFLPKRSSSQMPDVLPLSDKIYLECIVSVDDSSYPIRLGQKVRVSIGVE